MDLTELKNYLRIDCDFDDSILSMLQTVAESYILNAVGQKNFEHYQSDSRFKFAVALLVGHWYEQRLASTDVNLSEIPFGVTALIQQLRGFGNEKTD
ncbi:UNVERIFIED_ORG: putative phage protein (predicted DNA packaging) [Heyndrickxia coagulans]